MFYCVHIDFFTKAKNWRGQEKEYHLVSRTFTTHESHIDEQIKEHEKSVKKAYRDAPSVSYHVEKYDLQLTVRQALDLYPEDFKLWCAENGFDNLLSITKEII